MTAWTDNELWLLNEMKEQGKGNTAIAKRLNRLIHNGLDIRDDNSVWHKIKSLKPRVANVEECTDLFRCGFDTLQIAGMLGETEAAVYNALARRERKDGNVLQFTGSGSEGIPDEQGPA